MVGWLRSPAAGITLSGTLYPPMYPTLFHIGPIPIRSYGVMVLIGFLLALWYVMRAAQRRMAGRDPKEPGVITPERILDMSLIGLFIGILGTRVVYVLLNLGEFRQNPLDVFKIWTGGLTFLGAPIFAFTYLYWCCRRYQYRFLELADLIAPAFALGYAIGRIGCFLNGCCYGHACDLPWAVSFHFENASVSYTTAPSHPTQLYATIMSLITFFLLDRWSRRPHRDGEIFLGYIALYCIYRFIDEHFRNGATAQVFLFGLTHAQVFCVALLPVALILLWRLRRRSAPPTVKEAAS